MASELIPPSYGDLLEALREATRLLRMADAHDPTERDALRSILKSLGELIVAADAGIARGVNPRYPVVVVIGPTNARDKYFNAQLGLSPYDAGFLASLNTRW